MSQTLTITRPDDWHLHVRDGVALAAVVPHSAAQFARALIMPNLRPPVTTTALAQDRRKQRQQDRQHVEPDADRHRDDDRPADRAEHETDGDREHVDNDDVLESPRIEAQQSHVQ